MRSPARRIWCRSRLDGVNRSAKWEMVDGKASGSSWGTERDQGRPLRYYARARISSFAVLIGPAEFACIYLILRTGLQKFGLFGLIG